MVNWICNQCGKDSHMEKTLYPIEHHEWTCKECWEKNQSSTSAKTEEIK